MSRAVWGIMQLRAAGSGRAISILTIDPDKPAREDFFEKCLRQSSKNFNQPRASHRARAPPAPRRAQALPAEAPPAPHQALHRVQAPPAEHHPCSTPPPPPRQDPPAPNLTPAQHPPVQTPNLPPACAAPPFSPRHFSALF